MNRSKKNNFPKRKFLGLYFQCCSLYGRIYINNEKTAYEGTCPGCAKRVKIAIGENGTSSRMFIAE
jgi:hypothetical protein